MKDNTAETSEGLNAVSRLRHMRALGAKKPAFHFGRVPGKKERGEYRTYLPMKRPWPLIIILAVFIAVFSLPLLAANLMQTGSITSLFELMFFIFTLFWMLGWSSAVLVMLSFLLALLFARECIVIRGDRVLIRMEWFGIGVGATYLKKYISNLHVSQAETGGNNWRGNHLVFEYLGVPVPFGSELDGALQSQLIQRMNLSSEDADSPAPPGSATEADQLASETNVVESLSQKSVLTSENAAEEAREVRSTSSLLLILANIVPVFGVILLGWSIGDLMLLFWIESAIIGLFNAVKIFMVGRWAALFYVPFFVGHFGGFMAVHLMFVFALFVSPQQGDDLAATAATFLSLWPAILSLFISHGFSFFVNFLGRKEYRNRTVKQQMSEPYKRIIVMHVTIIFGGFMVMALSSTLAPLLLLIGLKMVIDLYAHHQEHRDEIPENKGS